MFVSTCAYPHDTHHRHKHKAKHAQVKKEKHARVENTSVLVFNTTKSTHEYSKMTNVVRPIASVTKLMTAMVALNYDKNMERHLNINSPVGGSLPRNRSYSRYELLNAMLVKSDNSAAETFSTDYPGGRKAFLDEMNRLALEYGMISSHFDDPTGLSIQNTSSAIDVATMVARASEYNLIREISTKKQVEIDTPHKKKTRTIVLNNTNRPVLFEFDSIIVSKTGFTNPAGYCLALAVDKNNQKYSVVILGARDKYDRIRKVEDIMYHHINDN
jgi:D-alanyl-D-alanine endopeptidase (penicillin-binding protein 7)